MWQSSVSKNGEQATRWWWCSPLWERQQTSFLARQRRSSSMPSRREMDMLLGYRGTGFRFLDGYDHDSDGGHCSLPAMAGTDVHNFCIAACEDRNGLTQNVSKR